MLDILEFLFYISWPPDIRLCGGDCLFGCVSSQSGYNCGCPPGYQSVGQGWVWKLYFPNCWKKVEMIFQLLRFTNKWYAQHAKISNRLVSSNELWHTWDMKTHLKVIWQPSMWIESTNWLDTLPALNENIIKNSFCYIKKINMKNENAMKSI